MTAHERLLALSPDGDSSKRTATILVVEDVELVQRVIEASLAELHADVAFVRDGESALAELETALPDLIILDLAMPIMDGWEFLSRLRVMHRTASVPVLVVTAHGQSGTATEVATLGANAYMEKPFLPGELIRAARDLLTTNL